MIRERSGCGLTQTRGLTEKGRRVLTLLIYAFLAGLATVLAPCILPILPVVLGSSLRGDRRRPLGVVTGLVLGFASATLAVTALVRALHLPADALRGDVVLRAVEARSADESADSASVGVNAHEGSAERWAAAGRVLSRAFGPSGHPTTISPTLRGR